MNDTASRTRASSTSQVRNCCSIICWRAKSRCGMGAVALGESMGAKQAPKARKPTEFGRMKQVRVSSDVFSNALDVHSNRANARPRMVGPEHRYKEVYLRGR